MRLRRRKQATAVALAVLGGLLSTGAQAAVAAPAPPGSPALTTSDRADGEGLPAVWPRPQSLKASGPSLALSGEATLVADARADPYAVDAVRTVLRNAGVRTVHETQPGAGPVVRVGGAGARDALRALRAPEREDLPAGGYRIAVGRASGRDTVALDGVGADGLFHAAQTLRRLVREGRVAGVTVRDWPSTAVRGMTEGFYGQPWSREERLTQIEFMGRTKQNRYLYAAGDDPYRQTRWRDPYPAERRADFRALAAKARAEHVTLGWAVAPGQAMCMSSANDVKALTRKIDAMWTLGVRVFQLQFQDVSYSEWHCGRDAETFGSGPEAAARAQAGVASAVQRHLADRYPGAQPLSVMPTEFYQDGTTAYREALARELDERVQVAWTGVGVVPRTITGGELAGARDAFRHPLITMDNYPVNDFAQDRIFLGPYTGREPAVAIGSAALLANAMEQPAASRIPLFTAADFAWNPRGYRPQESWQAAIDDLAGGDARTGDALRALAGNNAASVLGADESAYLRPLLAAFRASRTSPRAGAAAREEAARELRAAFTVMRRTPQRLKGAAGGALVGEVRPWSEQLSRYGRAGELTVDLLEAQRRGDGAAAWRASLALEPVREALRASDATVGEGVLDPFLDRAREEADAWTGADRAYGTVTKAPGGYTVRFTRPRPVETVTAATVPGEGTADATLEAHVPGGGWRSLGAVSREGWTQLAAKSLRADAVRITWPTGTPAAPPAYAGASPLAPGGATGSPPRVRALVPWFGDEPAARLSLNRSGTDAEIGGGPQRVTATLTPLRPAEVRGALTAKAPEGVEVRVPKRTTVPRGSRTEVPLDITVPAGTPAGEYAVPLRFGDEERTLTVRAFPRTGGPDLIRTATASSSGDETPDFPAGYASDGDPATRWSSPVEDGAWWQAELPRTARVGRVVLRWQDAYASRYRVQVSSDGRRWRTAATVRDGGGGLESVRMDAKDTRFIRVRGDARGTEYGYSLWSVEAYAVEPPAVTGR